MNPRAIEERLRWVRRAIVGQSFVRSSACVAAAALAELLALVALDAVRPMPPWGLATASLAWVGGLGAGVVRAAWRSVRDCPNVYATARLIEERAAAPHNRIINAVWFSRAGAAGVEGSCAASLIARTIERGGVGLAAASDRVVLGPERSGGRRSLGLLLIAVVAVGGSAAILPRVFAAALPRFAEPFGDHPAYSPTGFHLSFEPAEPSVGDDVRVRVRASGARPRDLRLVIRDEGAVARSLPLAATTQPEPGGAQLFTATLRDVRSPLRVFADGDTGRSSAITIVPALAPRIVGAAATITPPGYAGRAAETRALGVSPGTNALSAIVGSEIELHITSTVRLAARGVVVAPADAAPAPTTSAAGCSLSAHFGAVAARAFEIEARPVSEGGVPGSQSVRVGVSPRPDEPPTLRLLNPAWSADDLLAPAGATLLFDLEALDDLGLRVLGVAYSVFDAGGEWRSYGAVMHARVDRSPILTGRGDIVRFSPRLVLPRLGAEPGGSLTITLLAVDTRVEPFGEPQRSAVGPIVVRLAPSGAGSCGGRCDGWIQMPSAAASSAGESSDDQAGDTWDSDGPRKQRGDDSGPGRPARTSDADETDTSIGAEAAGDAADESAVADSILDVADGARSGRPAGERRADRSRREASEAAADPEWRVPDAYRDVVARYFRLLNEKPDEGVGGP